MKTKKILKSTLALVLVCLMAFSFTACAKSVTVNVNDAGTKTEIEAKTGSTISEVLEEAGITVGKQDEAEPSLDSELTEEVTEITVKRYAKVKVYKGDVMETVELVGGKVEDAIKKAGFTLEDGEEADAELDSYLKDGMEINITRETKVTLTVDGELREILTKAPNVKKLLEEQKITLGENDEVSEKTDAELKDGMKITVKRVEYKEETKKESIDFTSEKQYSDSMYEGESKTTQNGSKGEKEVTYKVKYVDGKEDSREKVSEKVTKEPVKEIVTYGTKKQAAQSNNSTGNNTASTTAPATKSQGKTVVKKVPIYDCDGSGHGYYEIYYSDGTVEYEEF